MGTKMVLRLFTLVLVCLVWDGGAAPAEDKYTTRYDNIDVDAILKSKRLLTNYMKCALDKGPCTREGQELRKRLPDAIQTDCTKCSVKQKELAGKVLAWLLQYEKGYFEQLLDKYDPEKVFYKRFQSIGEGDDDSEDY